MIKILASREKLPVFIFLALTCLLVYANTFVNEFVWDDNLFIKDSYFIKTFSNITKIFRMGFWEGSYRSYRATFYRPVVMASFLIDYALWGLNVFGYHLTNLLVYIGSVWLVFLIACKFIPIRGAFFGALVFLLHPVHTESVTFICGRTDVLAGFFLFLSIYCFIKTLSGDRYFVLGALSYLTALLCKEISLVGIVIFFGIWVCFSDKRDRNLKTLGRLAVPYLFVIVVYIWLRSLVGGSGCHHVAPGGKMLYTFFTMPKIWIIYFFKFFMPVGLTVEYSPEILTSFLSVSFIVSSIILCIFFIYVLFCYKYGKMRQFFFLSIIVLGLLPVSNIIPIGVLIADRFLYIPSFGFAVLFGWYLDKISRRYGRIGILIGFSIMLCFAVLTIRRNSDWKDQVSLWTKTASTNPMSFRAYGSLAQIYLKQGMYSDAVEAINKAYLLNPGDHRILGNMAVIYMELKQYDNAQRTLKKALKLEPRDFRTYGNLFGVYLKQNRLNDALWAINQAIKFSPQNIQLRLARADLFKITKKPEKSIREYREILKRFPKNLDALFGLGDIYMTVINDREKALAVYERIIGFDRTNQRALEKLRELK